MIDPLAPAGTSTAGNPLGPVLPTGTSAVPNVPEAPAAGPRYLTELRDGRSIKTVVRRDGLPLGYVPPPTPDPLPEALGLRLFDGNDGSLPRWLPPALVPPPPKIRRPRQPKPPPDPDAPVFTPEQIKAARENELRLSQRDLAPLLGTNRGQLDGAEHGRRHLSPYSARRLAALLAEKRARKGA